MSAVLDIRCELIAAIAFHSVYNVAILCVKFTIQTYSFILLFLTKKLSQLYIDIKIKILMVVIEHELTLGSMCSKPAWLTYQEMNR